MTTRDLHLAATTPPPAGQTYESGRCNIGPAEIARRRRVGHFGTLVTAILLAALLVTGAPSWARLALFVPAAVAAGGYLQAYFRFCADYGWRGVFNFGEAGHDRVSPVRDPKARSQDRRRAALIGLGSGAVGLAVGLGSLLIAT
jgi:hypothetical protein